MTNGFCSLVLVFLAIVTAFVAAQNDLPCGNGFSAECGEAVGKKVALDQGPPVSLECCTGLVKIGKACHDAYTQEHIKRNVYVGAVADVLRRSNEVWFGCVTVVGAPTPRAA